MSNNKPSKITPSELVLSAIFFLQQKRGITVKDITKFICEKRGCKQSHVKHEVKKALEKATENGIFSKKRGLYKIESGFGKSKISIKINGRSRPKKTIKRDSAIREPSDLEMSPFNETYDAEYIPDFSKTNYSVKKKFKGSDLNKDEPMEFNSGKGNRVSIERIKQVIMGEEDDDDEDFFEEDEAEEDEDMDFFSDDESHFNYIHQKSDFVQEKTKEFDVDKKKTKLAKKCVKYKSKNKNGNKAKKRKASKPRKKANKRKRVAACRSQRKAEKESNSEITNEKNQENKGKKEKNTKMEGEETQPHLNSGCTPNLMDDFTDLNEEDMFEEDLEELNSGLYSKNGEGYESDGYLSPNEEILMDSIISRDGTLLEKSENSQDSQKSNAEVNS